MPKFNRPLSANQLEEFSGGNGKFKRKKFRRRNKRGIEGVLPEEAEGKLDNRERRFVLEYIKDYNGLQAALRAGSSKVSAGVIACNLLKRINIQQAIEAYEKGLATRFINTKEKVLKEMSLLAHSDLKDFLTADGELRIKNLRDLPPQITRAIKRFRVHTTTRRLKRQSDDGNPGDEIIEQKVDFELYDKKGALDRMGQELGIFRDTKVLTGENGTPLIPASTKIILDFGAED
jgi:phage terminase small subunit